MPDCEPVGTFNVFLDTKILIQNILVVLYAVPFTSHIFPIEPERMHDEEGVTIEQAASTLSEVRLKFDMTGIT